MTLYARPYTYYRTHAYNLIRTICVVLTNQAQQQQQQQQYRTYWYVIEIAVGAKVYYT